jgi:hypothetical protein
MQPFMCYKGNQAANVLGWCKYQNNQGWECSSVVESLPSMCEALRSIHRPKGREGKSNTHS